MKRLLAYLFLVLCLLWCNVGFAAVTTVDCDGHDEACNWRAYKAIDKAYTKVWGIVLNGKAQGDFTFLAGTASLKEVLDRFHNVTCKEVISANKDPNAVCKVTHIGNKEISDNKQIKIAKQYYSSNTLSNYFPKNKKNKETLTFCVHQTQSAKSGFGYPVTKYNQNSICEGKDFVVTEKSNKVLFDFLINQYEARGGGIFHIKPYNLAKLESNQTQEIAKTEKKIKKLQKEKSELAKIETSSSNSLDDQKNIIEKSENKFNLIEKLKNLKIKKENNELAKAKKELKKLQKEKAELVKIKKELKKIKKENVELAKIKNTTRADISNLESDEKYYALVIGNNNYEHLQKLDAAENDAKVIANVLKNKYGFEVELLLNADYDTTVNSLHNISKKLTKNDNLLIFYAGHGELDKKQNRGYWLPVDASYELRSKWISNAIVADELKATDAKHVLLIVDSCFSGSLMRSSNSTSSKQKLDEDYIRLLQKKKTRLVITSGGNEPVMDSDGGEHSIFAKKLIDTLRENDNVITTQKIFENIRRYVASNAEQTPERAAIYKAGHDGGDFLFFAKNEKN